MPNMKALVAALALTQLSVPVCAFNPTWLYDGFGIIGKPHVAMTEKAFNTRSKAYFNIENPSRTMKAARGQMKDGSAIVDHHGDAEAEDSKCHFDDENFFNSNGRLIDKKSEVVDALLADDLAKARNSLGRALHTLQDFYSHSNWVELGKTEISQNLGKTWPLEIAPAAEIDPLIPTCKDCSYTFSRAVALDTAAECRRLSLLGSVFIDPMGAFEKAKIIKCMFPDPLFEWGHCDKPGNLDIPADLSSPVPHLLTSGWFGTKLKLHSDRPKGKCSHGGPFDRDADGLEGISKDTSHRFFSPHFDRHAEAADLALKATEKYFDDLRDILCTTGSGAKIEEKDCLPLKKLFGVGPPMAFTIDTTGSMGNVIASVRKDAIAIVNARRKTLDEPGYYVLSEINDPAPTSATVYFDPDSFIAAISRLGAFGGGDCPEYAMAGLANALDKMSSGGSIHLWTDAAAKDVALAQTITQRAGKQKVSIYTYLFTSGGCSTSEGFSFVSLGSGGQSFGDLSPSEAGNTANLAGSLVSENKVEIWNIIVNALNPFKLRHRAAGPFAYDIPVDSSMTVMTVSLSGTAVALSLFRPDGTEVKAGVADIVITTLSTGTIYTISKPATGLWKVTVSGKTGFSISVFGTSTLQFDSFDFVESAGANHDGYFPVTSTPVPGTKAICVAVLDGSFASADFEFRSTDGLFLGKLGLIHGTGDSEFEAPSNHFWGNLTVPSGAFNVYVSGKDTAGTPYQRVLPGILTPVPSNFTNPTNFTSSSTSMTPTAFLNSTTSFPATTSGSSGSTSGDHISSSCQPTPTEFVTTLTQTVIYYTCSPVETSNAVTYLTSTVTTTIDVPCYSECHIPLPVISPGPTVTSLDHHTSTLPSVAAATALSIQGPSKGSSYDAPTSVLSSVNYISSAEESRGDLPAPTSMEASHSHTASGEGVSHSLSHASIPGPVSHKSSGAPTTNVTSSGPKILSTVVPGASRKLRSDGISSALAVILIVVMGLL